MNEKNRTYSSTFDNTTMYDVGGKININLVNDKFNLNKRPKPIKEIPHKDYYSILPYSNPYYTIKETGYNNINYKDIFKKYY